MVRGVVPPVAVRATASRTGRRGSTRRGGGAGRRAPRSGERATAAKRSEGRRERGPEIRRARGLPGSLKAFPRRSAEWPSRCRQSKLRNRAVARVDDVEDTVFRVDRDPGRVLEAFAAPRPRSGGPSAGPAGSSARTALPSADRSPRCVPSASTASAARRSRPSRGRGASRRSVPVRREDLDPRLPVSAT